MTNANDLHPTRVAASVALFALLFTGAAASAQEAERAELQLDMSKAYESDAAAGETADAPGDRGAPFGRAGSTHLSFGAGYANNFMDDQDFNIYGGWSRFVADELEFCAELGGWYFDQTGDNTAGVNGNLYFRWHALHDDSWDWSVYGEVGIGLLAAFDNVPAEGTGFAFTPRAGAGFTHRLNDAGLRLQAGVRWHHISNGRILGDERNPSRDSLMVYAGVIIPL